MLNNEQLSEKLHSVLGDQLVSLNCEYDEVTIELKRENWLENAKKLRDECHFEQLIDVCSVDYLAYGLTQWDTTDVSSTGFSRAKEDLASQNTKWDKPRFAVIYHFLSLQYNARVRVKIFLHPDILVIDSLNALWPAANWFEREVYDLMGVEFTNHPDLRRILTDYGFIGYPFRKDFPLSGHVEVRYDKERARVVYGPVDVSEHEAPPKVIRDDLRFVDQEESQ